MPHLVKSQMDSIDVCSVLKQFDALRSQEELFYSPTLPIHLVDGGINFVFRVVSSYKSKPQLSPADSSSNVNSTKQASFATSKNRPPPSDGSDIDHSDPAFFVAHVNFQMQGDGTVKPTHKLILNKFCAFRPQYILLTTDPLARQYEPLGAADFHAAREMLQRLTTPHYLIFNGGKEGGSSRVHKHMQVLEEPEGFSTNMETAKLPYISYFVSLSPHSERGAGNNRGELEQTQAEVLHQAYQKHYIDSKRVLGIADGDDKTVVPHNVIMTRDWMLLVPRRSATLEGLEGHIVNAAGMYGQVWLNNEEQLAAWKKIGPTKVLASLSVPRGTSVDLPRGMTADEAVELRKF